jgi:hypothetical protein
VPKEWRRSLRDDNPATVEVLIGNDQGSVMVDADIEDDDDGDGNGDDRASGAALRPRR